MSPGEEADTPDMGQGRLAVVISGDGSVSIDGVPLPVMGDEPVDTAILDALHGHARSRNSPVTAAISDPSEDYVAVVEVAPDGSSRLLEQRESDEYDEYDEYDESEERDEYDGHASAGPGEYPFPPGTEAEPLEAPGGYLPDAPYPPGADDEPDALARTEHLPLTPPAPAADPGPGPVRKKRSSQSDDEYEPPGLLKRPLFIGVASVVTAAVVMVPLIVLGSSGGGQEQNQAAGTTQGTEQGGARPSTSGPAATSPSPSSSRSSSASPSRSVSAPPKQQPKQPKTPKTVVDPLTHEGGMFISNMKYGYCVDLPGPGRSAPDTRVQDATCKGDDNQEWLLDLALKGGGARGADLYLIHNDLTSDLCLDLPNFGPAPAKARMGVFPCNSSKKGDNQLWWLDKRSDGTYWIRNQQSGGKCLDVARTSSKAPNARVTISKCGEADAHLWSFLTQ